MLRTSFNDGWRVSSKQGNFGMAVQAEEKSVTLPYDAMIYTERKPIVVGSNKKGFFENGTWEYKKSFFVPEEYRDKKVILEFEGVYQRAMVYINGDLAGQRPYGYSGFLVECDRFLKYGEQNDITVAARTADDARWYSGAGIYRDVNLLVASQVYARPFGVKITTPDIDSERAVVCVAVALRNESGEAKSACTVVTEIVDTEGNVVASDTAPCTVFRGEEAVLRQRMFVKTPKLWDVDSPNLYTCNVKLLDASGNILDQSAETFGVRCLSLDYDNGLRINGEVVNLKGACIHHDNGPIGAASIYAAEERRVLKLKEAGFNAIRMSHHPASPALLKACDRLGMLVMDEAFDMWTTSKSDFDYALDFPEWWERDIEAMINKDYNCPSVIMYSIGNEIQDTGSQNGSAWGRKLAEKCRELDSTRYTTNGINGLVSVMELLMKMQTDAAAQAQAAEVEEQSGEINNMMASAGERMKSMMGMEAITHLTAESFACVDIAGYNYMDSRYAMDRELFPNRIIVGSETFPADIDQNWRKVLDNGNVIGDFTWTGWDYLGEAGIGKVNYPTDGKLENVYGGYPTLTAMTGDIDITGYRRPVSYYREIVFRQRTVPYIAVLRPEHYNDTPMLSPWSWSDSVSSWSFSGFEGKPVKIEVYSQSETVELIVNGKSVGKQPAGEQNRFKAVFDTVYEPGEITAVAYDGGRETGRFTLRSAQGEAALSASAERETIEAACGLGFINIAVADKSGTVFTTDNRTVTVSVDGCGELMGFGNADPDTTENFYGDRHSTFDGRALAVVRPTDAGEITVTVSAEGMEAVAVKLTAV